MKTLVSIFSLLCTSCAAPPTPLVTTHSFRQEVIIYNTDGSERAFTREFTCSFDFSSYRGGAWRFYFDRDDIWTLNESHYSPVTEEESSSRYSNGAIRLGSTSDQMTLYFYLGGCMEFMGLSGLSSRTAEKDIVAEGGAPSYNILFGREYWEQWGIRDVDFTTDHTIRNQAVQN